tara:strand:+ start:791 stop:2113 length:1323 start_codon:yes stop_codon:yes gene_type:complete
MLEQAINKLKQDYKNLASANFLLAVSGGVDSMLLWYLIHQLKVNYSVAHVNFQLRSEASEGDKVLVRNFAEKLNVRLFVHRAETKKLAKKWSLSTQETARKIRYDFFEELKKENGFTHLLTAHHLDDSIETFFINLNRGTGLKGLSGIKEHEGILRPLLSYSKEEIRALAEEAKVPFREDASNTETNYLRNFFRLEILPLWEKRNPEFRQIMQENLQKLKEAEQLYQEVIEEEKQTILQNFEQGFIAIEKLTHLRYPKLVLAELLTPLGFNYQQIESLIEISGKPNSGKLFESKTHVINLDRERLFIIEKANVNQVFADVIIENYPTKIETPIKLEVEKIDLEKVEFQEESTYYFDADKLSWPLKLRKWREGDRIQPLGMRGKKKVSDVLIDQKVPLMKKKELWLLENNQNIIALLGFGISEQVKLDTQTKKVIRLKWTL